MADKGRERASKGAHEVAKAVSGAKEEADDTARGVASSAPFRWAVRGGYIVRGGLYGFMGVLALLLALGTPTTTADQRGSLFLLPSGAARIILLPLIIGALVSYSAWGFVRALYDPLGRGSDASGIAARVGFAWSSLNYFALAIFGGFVLLGRATSNGRNSIYVLVHTVLSVPAGRIAIIVAGAIGTLAGLGQFWDAYRAAFRRDLNRRQMSPTQRVSVDRLGRAGMIARGVIFTIVGYFILVAGISDQASKTKSIAGAFFAVDGAPMGRVLLGLVAAGFIALGAHSVAQGIWIRLPKRRAQVSRD